MNLDSIGSGEVGQPPYRQAGGSHRMKLLPIDFVPSEDDVICGRGKKCYSHIGNDRFRTRVHSVLSLYRSARTKLDKSKVLNMVVEQVRQNSPGGGFVKQDETGRWHEVGDFLAREKTSQAFRDALHENYKSSNVSKKKRRQEELSKASDKLKMPRSSLDIARKIENMSMEMKKEMKNTKPSERGISDPNADIMAGIQYASRDMRRDNFLQGLPFSSAAGPPSPSRISSANELVSGGGGGGGFEFEFEPDGLGGGNHSTGGIGLASSAAAAAPYDERQSASYSAPSSTTGMMMEPGSERITRRRYSENVFHQQRAESVPNVPQFQFDFAGGGDGGSEPLSPGSEELHHSLPNIQFDPDDLEDASERMHRSAPTLCYYSQSDLEAPVPTTIEFQTGVGGPLPTTSQQQFDDPQTPNSNPLLQQERRDISSGAAGIVSSLERFAGMELEDDNPFEPIPIGQEPIFPDNGTSFQQNMQPHPGAGI